MTEMNRAREWLSNIRVEGVFFGASMGCYDNIVQSLAELLEQVAADERERAAALCEQHADSNAYSAEPLVAGIHDGFRKAARAIRARSPKTETPLDATVRAFEKKIGIE